jgi:hypothetical protein
VATTTTNTATERNNEAVGREEEAKGVGRQDGMEEQETARQEVKTGEQKGIEERRDKARGDPPPPTAHPTLKYDNGEGATRG